MGTADGSCMSWATDGASTSTLFPSQPQLPGKGEAWASPPALSPREPETFSPPGGGCTWGPVGPSLATSSVLEKVLKHGSGSTVDADSFTAFLV